MSHAGRDNTYARSLFRLFDYENVCELYRVWMIERVSKRVLGGRYSRVLIESDTTTQRPISLLFVSIFMRTFLFEY